MPLRRLTHPSNGCYANHKERGLRPLLFPLMSECRFLSSPYCFIIYSHFFFFFIFDSSKKIDRIDSKLVIK